MPAWEREMLSLRQEDCTALQLSCPPPSRLLKSSAELRSRSWKQQKRGPKHGSRLCRGDNSMSSCCHVFEVSASIMESKVVQGQLITKLHPSEKDPLTSTETPANEGPALCRDKSNYLSPEPEPESAIGEIIGGMITGQRSYHPGRCHHCLSVSPEGLA